MFEQIFLEPTQDQLLKKLVEAHRNVPPELRHNFRVVSQQGSGNIVGIGHNGFPSKQISVNIIDVETLEGIKFIATSGQTRHPFDFSITPDGFQYYEQIREKENSGISGIEKNIKEYINDIDFNNKYTKAFHKWLSADDLLWQSDSNEKLTQIGHLCRESVQEFSEVLIHNFNLHHLDNNKTHSKVRIKIVLDNLSNKLGDSEKQFLISLLSYWDSIIDLIQKQEHGALKESKQLIWEDGRRVVFQTLIVMYEIDRTISHSK